MRSTAFVKLYKICILLHRCNLKIFAKNRFEKSAFFVKIQQKFCKCRTICKILPKVLAQRENTEVPPVADVELRRGSSLVLPENWMLFMVHKVYMNDPEASILDALETAICHPLPDREIGRFLKFIWPLPYPYPSKKF